MQVLVLLHVEELIPIVEDCHHAFIWCFFHGKMSASAGFDEEVFLHVAVAAFYQHPAMLPPAFEFIFVLQIRDVVHPNVFCLFAFFFKFGGTFSFLLLPEGRALLICFVIDLKFVHESFAVSFMFFSVVILVGKLNPRIDLINPA